MGFHDGLIHSTRNHKQINRMALKRRQGKPKPYKECEECLFIMDDCTICEIKESSAKYPYPDNFVVFTILYPDEITESILEDLDAIPNVETMMYNCTAASRRTTTQIRDGSV